MATESISCLCVSWRRPALLRRSLALFAGQTYADRELVLVHQSDDPETIAIVRDLADPRIRPIRVEAEPRQSLGNLRNISIAEARGEYLCIWDDDDWYHPDRLAAQLEALRESGKPACVLSRITCLDAPRRRAYIAHKRTWEPTLLCRKAAMKPYADLPRGEDRVVLETLLRENKLHPLDRPDLYVYTYHGENTWGSDHWFGIINGATPLSAAEGERIAAEVGTPIVATRPGVATGPDPEALAGTRLAFEEAVRRSPTPLRVSRFRFAGLPVRVRVAGTEMADQLDSAFEHLRSDDPEDAPFALAVDAWDHAQTRWGCPGLPLIPESTTALDGGLMTIYDNGGILRHERVEGVDCLDRARGQIFCCRNDATRLALTDRIKPFPWALAAWYRDRGVKQVHASLVSRDGDGVLFIGPGGSGKSTTALTCALAGFGILGDDHVGLQQGEDGTCWGHSFYNGTRVDERLLGRLPGLAPHAIQPVFPWDEKAMVLMSRALPGCPTPRTRVRAVVMPRVVGSGTCRVAPAGRIETLLHLARNTLQTPMSPGLVGFFQLADFMPGVRCYRLEIGENLDEIPGCVGAILDEASAKS